MKVLCLFLITFFPAVIFAQSNYHAGYIVRTNGDTLKGYINYREWERSPRSIEFKVNKDDKQQFQFTPSTIKTFQITGLETYRSYTGVVSMNKTNFRDVPEGLDTTKKTDTIFLRQLATGKHLTLYRNEDDIKTRFFTATTNGSPVELRYYEYYNQYNQIANSAVYKGQLLIYINEFTPGNNKLIEMANNANYSEIDLEPFANEINNNGVTAKKKSSGRLFFGFAINKTITEVDNVNYIRTVKDNTTIAPRVSMGIDVFNNPNVQQLAFRIELSFTYVNPEFKYPITVSGTQTNQVYSFTQYTAFMVPQILFNVYNKDNFKVYLDAGVAFNFSAYTGGNFTSQSSDPDVVKAYSIQNIYKLQPLWTSFPFQAGVTLNKKIEICFTYVGYTAYTKYTSFYASNQTISLGVKFLLNRN
ncbi:MAG TPA: hypothetical protein VGN20_01505 [Mucilaginibacter sp.]|jgi:hypothetical protein